MLFFIQTRFDWLTDHYQTFGRTTIDNKNNNNYNSYIGFTLADTESHRRQALVCCIKRFLSIK